MSEFPAAPSTPEVSAKTWSASEMEQGAIYEQHSCDYFEPYEQAAARGDAVDPASQWVFRRRGAPRERLFVRREPERLAPSDEDVAEEQGRQRKQAAGA